jgi:hypothetical protein
VTPLYAAADGNSAECRETWRVGQTNAAEVTLYFSRIWDSPHALHVFSAFAAGANIDLERASGQHEI